MRETSGLPIVRAIVKAVIGILLLLIIEVLIASLPMLNQSIPFVSVYLPYSAIATAAARTAMFVLLVRLGSELRIHLAALVPRAPEFGQIAQLATWLLPIALGYMTYADIANALIGSGMWFYQLFFIVAAAANVVAIGALLLRNLDTVTDLVLPEIRRLHAWAAARPPANTSPLPADAECPQCHRATSSEQRFCRSCGATLQVSETRLSSAGEV